MEARLVKELPASPGWFYEPKWDGFRAVVVRDEDNIEIWSKSGKPLGRYFPEVLENIRALDERQLVLDGELVIPIGDHLSFEALQARLHPAASRIARLARETPAQLILFDCLRLGTTDFIIEPLVKRRAALERLLSRQAIPSLILSPISTELAQAKRWLAVSGGALDGVIAKPSDEHYRPGERAMQKVKQLRTADCVVGGYRKSANGHVRSLLLGLYGADEKLDLVGFASAFSAAERARLRHRVEMYAGGVGFTGRAPGGPSRWNPGKSSDYVPLAHELVVEVVYDQITGGRFRHGTRLLRWRPDKAPWQCTHAQLSRELKPADLVELLES